MKENIDILNSKISDELLAAYIDGNLTENENALIENSLNEDSMLSETCEIVSDSVPIRSIFDWELHKGDFGFWEIGLPPAVTNTEIEEQTNVEVPECLSLPSTDVLDIDVGADLDNMSIDDLGTNDLNTNDY